MASIGSSETKARKAPHQKQLQKIILRAIVHGHLEVVKETIKVLLSHFDENLPHDGKQSLDFFLEKDALVSAQLYIFFSFKEQA